MPEDHSLRFCVRFAHYTLQRVQSGLRHDWDSLLVVSQDDWQAALVFVLLIWLERWAKSRWAISRGFMSGSAWSTDVSTDERFAEETKYYPASQSVITDVLFEFESDDEGTLEVLRCARRLVSGECQDHIVVPGEGATAEPVWGLWQGELPENLVPESPALAAVHLGPPAESPRESASEHHHESPEAALLHHVGQFLQDALGEVTTATSRPPAPATGYSGGSEGIVPSPQPSFAEFDHAEVSPPPPELERNSSLGCLSLPGAEAGLRMTCDQDRMPYQKDHGFWPTRELIQDERPTALWQPSEPSDEDDFPPTMDEGRAQPPQPVWDGAWRSQVWVSWPAPAHMPCVEVIDSRSPGSMPTQPGEVTDRD